VRGIIPFTVGVEIDQDGFLPLIVKNSLVPARVTRLFTTLSPAQQAIEIHILKGDRKKASRNASLGRFLVFNKTHLNLNTNPKIELTIQVGLDSLIHLTARILPSGRMLRTLVSTDGKNDLTESAAAGFSEPGLKFRLESLLVRLENLKKAIPYYESGYRNEVIEIIGQARHSLLTGALPDMAESRVMLETAICEIQAAACAGGGSQP
jgi:molecular chaperone DnaK (HSP70)